MNPGAGMSARTSPSTGTMRSTRAPSIFSGCRRSRRRQSASVLLEVVLALALFVGAATVISSGLNASIQAVYRLRLETHAANLAVSVLSEMQMHARAIVDAGPEPFAPPFEKWTWKIEITQPETSPLEADAMRKVEVIIRHTEEPVVSRITQFMRSSDVPPDMVEGMGSAPTFF